MPGNWTSAMISRRHPLLALLLTSTLLVLQTASSWLHSGCQQDHSAARTGAHTHHGHCQHGHVRSDSQMAVRQGDEQGLAGDCAACRYLMLSSLAVEGRESIVVEQVA